MTMLNHRLLSAAASVNATLVQNFSSELVRVAGHNAAASVRYIKLYDKATAPTVGTDTPIFTIAVPAGSVFSLPMDGFPFKAGLGFGLTTGAADADTGALTSGDILGLNITYRSQSWAE